MSSDCGCGSDDVATPSADDRRVVPGPITQLNPRDGLFLKAEHLAGIQDYATAVGKALGISVGTGVVYGFELTIAQRHRLTATPGLALTATGQPLQSGDTLEHSVLDADLPALEPGGYGFWVVEVVPEEDFSGNENAYGTVCGDPCEGVNAIQPWRRSLVRLRLRPDTITGPPPTQRDQIRSWLASAYFERERRLEHPWVVPGRQPAEAAGPVASLFTRDWVDAGAAPDELAVPVGVLMRVGGTIELDTWTARRELAGPPGQLRWDGHLGRRPWPDFVAQLLQFENQLAGFGKEICGAATRRRRPDPLAVAAGKYLSKTEKLAARWRSKEFDRLAALVESRNAEVEVVGGVPSLVELGFVELPPAGYLGCVDADQARAKVPPLFAERVELRFCEVRADHVAGAVQAAQHLDRIPLDPVADPMPQVDVLIPLRPADLAALKTPSYGWVAFVRRSERACDGTEPGPEEPRTEPVEIIYSFDALDTGLGLLRGGIRPASASLAVIHYPVDGADLPAGQPKPAVLNGVRVTGVVGVTPTADGERLAAGRADGLISGWQLGSVTSSPPVVSASFPQPLVCVFVEGILL